MARGQSALSELLDALRAGGDLDVIREGLALVLQALIDAEATQHLGARPYERTEQRTAHRNGTRSRLLSTKAGDVELRIPKLREGSFFPALLEPRRRIDRALLAVVMQAYVPGTSTRKVDDLVKAWVSTAASPSPRSPGSAPSSTPRSARSGPRSCARSRPEDWPGGSWWSLTPTPASPRPSPPLWPAPAGNAAGCISCARAGPGAKGSAEMVAAAIRTIFAQPTGQEVSTRSTRSPPCSRPSSRP
jgi:hypothetical protein